MLKHCEYLKLNRILLYQLWWRWKFQYISCLRIQQDGGERDNICRVLGRICVFRPQNMRHESAPRYKEKIIVAHFFGRIGHEYNNSTSNDCFFNIHNCKELLKNSKKSNCQCGWNVKKKEVRVQKITLVVEDRFSVPADCTQCFIPFFEVENHYV